MIALVKKLPQEIIDYFTGKVEPANLNYFTERRLSPLTLLKSDEAKIERFREMKNVSIFSKKDHPPAGTIPTIRSIALPDYISNFPLYGWIRFRGAGHILIIYFNDRDGLLRLQDSVWLFQPPQQRSY